MSTFIEGFEIGDDGRGGRIVFAGMSPAVLPGALDAADAAIERATTPVVHAAVASRRGRAAARREADRISTEPKGPPMRGSLNDVDAYVGRRLRQRRMALGLSQEKLGEAVDLTFQQIQKYEKGANRVGASRLAQFAAILQVTPGWFFEGAPVPDSASGAPAQPTDDASGLLASREGLRLARAFLKIGDRAVQAKVADLVEVICRAPTAAQDGAMAA